MSSITATYQWVTEPIVTEVINPSQMTHHGKPQTVQHISKVEVVFHQEEKVLLTLLSN